ncbi:MAG: DUF63 family protein [Candidatus Aenigmarchaeota archaeon]|nr:DUF63 family protein [Candidatus Aenigmarchaeota archaeon]
MLSEFIQKWYIDPVVYNTGYNPVNTATYGIMLIAAAIGIYHLLKSRGIPMDQRLLTALVPYIFAGAMLRAFEDLLESQNMSLGLFTVMTSEGPRNMLLVSPVIYVTMFLIASTALAISIVLSKPSRVPYDKIMFSIGAVFILALLSVLIPNIKDLFAVGMMLSVAALFAVLVFGAHKYLAPKYAQLKFLTKENAAIISAHLFDASTTFTALQFYDYFEQHFLPRFVISIFGPASMFMLKLAVVPAALYYIDKEVADNNKRTLFKLIVLILGLGPGLRNFFRLAMGV